jgi:nucleotide-binding universal stress UspA family protein
MSDEGAPSSSGTDPLFDRPVVPIANEEDARATAEAAVPYLTATDGHVRVVYVVEKAGGAIDKASVEQREQAAEAAFDAFRAVVEATASGLAVETEILYGTDVVETILEDAAGVDATAIAFSPRGEPGKRSFMDWLTGDVRDRLVTEADRPVVVLPVAHGHESAEDEGEGEGEGEGHAEAASAPDPEAGDTDASAEGDR